MEIPLQELDLLAAAFETGRIAQLRDCFACFDERLNKAAKVLGMACLR